LQNKKAIIIPRKENNTGKTLKNEFVQILIWNIEIIKGRVYYLSVCHDKKNEL
tara:strand:- start:2327 stop:2485 length:159 start_codon:yes stop_codon:yes gene_type:complete